MARKSMTARDLMTTAVVSVPPDMRVASLRRLLVDHGISAVPVTDARDALLGIVTEADLLRPLAGAEDRPMSWLRGLFSDLDRLANNYARTHGQTAKDVMTRDVVSVTPETSAEHCAHLMEDRAVRRLPVVEGNRLLGIVSRPDLLRAVMEVSDRIDTPIQAGDAAIRGALGTEIRKQAWVDVYLLFADVNEGVVSLHGFVPSEAIRRAMLVLAQRIEGVVRVEDHLRLFSSRPAVGM